MYNSLIDPINSYLPALYVNTEEVLNIKEEITTHFKGIRINKKLKKSMIVFLGTVFYQRQAFASGLGGLDTLGFKILGVIQGISYWVCVAMCLKDILESVLSGGKTKDIGSIIVKYLILLASIHFIPQLFKEVPAMFDN